MAQPNTSRWDRARQVIQLLALVIDEAAKLIGALHAH
jgi:hypothetical protein